VSSPKVGFQFLVHEEKLVFIQNNISVISRWSVLSMEEKGVSRENYRAAAYIGQRLSNNVVSNASSHEWESNSQLYW
jgi:hypothetical protein